jgi:hypothetical protein
MATKAGFTNAADHWIDAAPSNTRAAPRSAWVREETEGTFNA